MKNYLLEEAMAKKLAEQGTDQLSEIDNADFADYVPPGMPKIENPISIPLEKITYDQLAKQQAIPTDYMKDALAETADQNSVAPMKSLSRAPAGQILGANTATAKDFSPTEEQPLGVGERLEKLMAERNAAYADAEKRQRNQELIGSLAGNLGNIIGGAQAMNTGASVTPAKTGFAAQNLTKSVDGKYKPELDSMLTQYKALQAAKLAADKANRPMDEYKRRMLGVMEGNLAQSIINSNRGMEKHYNTDNRLRGNQENKESEKNELSDKQSEQLAGYADTFSAFDRIRAQKKKVDTGPIADKQNQIASMLGIDDPEVSSLRAEVIDTLASKIKALSGTAASEPEARRLAITLPSLDMSDEVFNRMLDDAERRLQEAEQLRLDYFEKQGKDPSRFRRPQGKASAPASSNGSDAKVESFMQKNGITDRNEAIKILKDNGKL